MHKTLWLAALIAAALIACDGDKKKDTAGGADTAEANEAAGEEQDEDADAAAAEQPDASKGDADAAAEGDGEGEAAEGHSALAEEEALAMLGKLGAVANPTGAMIPADAKPQTKYKKLAHGAFKGRVGKHDGAVFLLADDGSGGSGGVAPFVAMKEGDAVKGYALEPLMYATSSVDAVFFEDLGEDGDVDVFILGKFMTGMGPSGMEEFPHTFVYTFDGDKFTRTDAFDEVLEGADTAARVREALARAGKLPAAK